MLSVLYFAWVREAIGIDGEMVERLGDGATVGDLVMLLAARGDGYAEALGDPARLRAAIDQRFVAMDAVIGDAREVALFPPVTGGSSGR